MEYPNNPAPPMSPVKPSMTLPILAIIFAILGIIFLAIIFTPIAIILSLIATFLAFKNKNSLYIGLTLLSYLLIVIDFITSPSLWFILIGLRAAMHQLIHTQKNLVMITRFFDQQHQKVDLTLPCFKFWITFTNNIYFSASADYLTITVPCFS